MISAEIKSMSMKNRIILMEELWDALCHDEKEITSPEWHRKVLDERRNLIESGKAKLISIDELKVGKNER